MVEKTGSGKFKIAAGSAIFAFILSLFAGIIGDVLPGALIGRALLFAALFTGIAAGLIYLVERFLPELLDLSSVNEDRSEDGDSEESVSAAGGDGAAAAAGAAVNISVDEDAGEYSYNPDDESGADGIPADGEGILEEVEDAEDADVLEDEDAPEAVEEEASGKPAQGSKAEGAGKKGKSPRSGDLPDITEFADSFESTQVQDVQDDSIGNIDGSSVRGAEILGGMHQTQEIVKAVQTVLKKDQVG